MSIMSKTLALLVAFFMVFASYAGSSSVKPSQEKTTSDTEREKEDTRI